MQIVVIIGWIVKKMIQTKTETRFVLNKGTKLQRKQSKDWQSILVTFSIAVDLAHLKKSWWYYVTVGYWKHSGW